MRNAVFLIVLLASSVAFSDEDKCFKLDPVGSDQTRIAEYDYLCQLERENKNFVVLVQMFGSYELKNIFEVTVEEYRTVLEREVYGARSSDFPTSLTVFKDGVNMKMIMSNSDSSRVFAAKSVRINLLPFELYQ